MLSFTEENYIKALLKISMETRNEEISSNDLSVLLGVKPATVNDMLKKLKQKELVWFERYGKIRLTPLGREQGLHIIRKHRLWETFLYEKLGFSWDEVHEVAEQLEHIRSEKLIDKLDEFLSFPETDPHGDEIPKKNGEIRERPRITLAGSETGKKYRITGVKDNSAAFLQYLLRLGLVLHTTLEVMSVEAFDGSLEINANGRILSVSQKLSGHIFVEPV